jgi:hypothetical protein
MQLGERQFTDGTTRPVYWDDDGKSGRGFWLDPDEHSEPVVLSIPHIG